MDGSWWSVSLICLCFVGKGHGVTLEILPSSQKVVENSPAIYTCVSSEDNGEFTWYRSGKLVDEEEDEVMIKQIDDYKSVLKVDRADIRKHKKIFKCTFTGEDGTFAEASVSLKVLPSSRAHKYFPHITPIRGGNDVMQEAPPGQMKLKCSTTINKQLPTWRWIKNDFVDLTLQENFKNGKMTISDDGELTIKDVSGEDSGMYMCVAENNRGTAYSTAFRVSVVQDPIGFTGCMDDYGYKSEVGETYKQADICTTCSCEEGGMLRCRSVACYPYCPPGKTPKMSEDECCVYDCIDEEVPSIGKIENDDICKDMNGAIIRDGETYNPDPNEPCRTCTCDDGEETDCRVMACLPPTCPGYILQPGTCCSFICPGDPKPPSDGRCIDRDGRAVMSDDIYMPKEDPCLQCICDNGRRGRCMMVACKAPDCENFIPSREVCCEYTCPDVPPLPSGLEGGCVDFHKKRVAHGDIYQPGHDPCEMCQCTKNGPELCNKLICDEPTCRNYILIPGTCCGFRCPDDEEPETITVNIDGSCLSYNNGMVEQGARYNPSHYECYTCTCHDGKPIDCSGDCITSTGHPPIEAMPRVIGRIVIQQTGTNDAIVQWSVPRDHQHMPMNITVHYHDLSTHQNRSIPVHEDNYLVLRGLQLNTMYDVIVNGTIGSAFVFSGIPTPYRFSLQSGYTSLSLNNALGQVFISHGSILADGYSLPREFQPVTRANGVDTLMNVRSFHMAEISKYNEAPCPDQDCGLIRFYMYNINGQPQNVVSLMFTSHQDFVWAKTHL
ncbi:hypothetical protein ACF0H5_004335 [Mactra antiquata]